ncbi:hypothetical protein [Arcobacter defluvii]|uniref:DUF5644 domain-containing protein n=1 Tax=Arcobacter defluvii TaxID=873191 RepID=A0AAE7BF83_9BACT|nr:hypothetical protein [Arcobacter defluvii]QKF78415.1 hypothetical protein ADFLV_2427 [Arcobacter defluvii]RXI30800.1 hypothetical protein CP964_11145 [Arcobacter defluvii]
MKLEISLFRFDKDSDYLPYYTKHFLKIENETSLLDILKTLHKVEEFGFVDSIDFDLVLNGTYVKTSLNLEEIVGNFGKELTIEPISQRRVFKDLLIDETDFHQKIEIFKDFIDDEDVMNYSNLKQYFYASNTLNYKSDYIGDSTLILAYNLIQKNPKAKNYILQILSEIECGGEYHTCLRDRIFNFNPLIEEKIHTVLSELGLFEDLNKQNFKGNKTLILDFGNFANHFEIVHDFKDFNIAYYPSKNPNQTLEMFDRLKANILKLDSMKLDLAKNTFNKNPQITYFVASTILLDAFDNNADFLVVDNEEDFYIFDYNRKEIEKLCGREILIPIIHKNELQKLISGDFKEAKKTLDKHQINPEII